MPPKKGKERQSTKPTGDGAHIENAGIVQDQPITQTLETNYMPYAMSVILSRALPEIDGFKPSHRKLLYTMYTMGLIKKDKIKSANVVGRTMQLNPHGDQAIYATMVRMTRGNEALLHPFVDSKGNFGKAYSRDMAFAAPRYTEVKLEQICTQIFQDIDKNTVEFVDNYDGSMKEPVLLPVTFPTILVNSTTGIAVGMASSICSFNLEEVCLTTIELLKNPKHNISDTLIAPDFPGGGYILYNRDELDRIYESGRGSFRVRARYNVDRKNNCIEITQIPPTTTVEAIIDKVADLIKIGKIREISDMRDETDLSGLKLAIDIKRGVDADKLMQKLFKMTPLEDSFACNFNVLVNGYPKVLGIREIIMEWNSFRMDCVKRKTAFDLQKKQEKLHLLRGLEKILLDIDKAVKIVRETDEEAEVVPNLMIGFGIDKTQAEYVAEIRLRQLNREYILNRTKEIDSLVEEIADMQDILANESRVKKIIISELRQVIKEFKKPRQTLLLEGVSDDDDNDEEESPNYAVNYFFSKEGYFKKITPQSLRMSNVQKLKDGDEILFQIEGENNDHLLFFTDKGQVYKAQGGDFDDTKASVLGDYLPARLGMDDGETPIYMAVTKDYKGFMLFAFAGGKVAKVDLAAYETKTKRRKLTGAYSVKDRLTGILCCKDETDVIMTASSGRILIIGTAQLSVKTTRDTQGVAVMNLKKGAHVSEVRVLTAGEMENEHRFRAKNLPATGAYPKEEGMGEQLTL